MPPSRTSRLVATVASSMVALALVFAFPVSARAAQDLGPVITADGVGPALVGSTPEALRAQLGPDFRVGPEVRITVDFDGFVITRDGEVQFRAAKTDDSDRLTLFIVSNADYRTAEGVGPGTSIADAQAVYGQPTLSWNPDNEGREFVSFANQPDDNIAFRTPGIGENNVGIYPEGRFETFEYEVDAEIAAVWVSCRPGVDCPTDGATTDPGTDNGDPGSDGGPTELPQTGVDELRMIAVVAALLVTGGMLVLIQRRLLADAG